MLVSTALREPIMIGALYELRELDELEADRPRRSKGLSAVEGKG